EDELNNSGRIAARDFTIFAGLDEFNNSGLIDLVDGDTDELLVTTGNYTGEGGTLALDVDVEEEDGDFFWIWGDADGDTGVIADFGPEGVAYDPDTEIDVIRAGGDADPDAFFLASGDAGFF